MCVCPEARPLDLKVSCSLVAGFWGVERLGGHTLATQQSGHRGGSRAPLSMAVAMIRRVCCQLHGALAPKPGVSLFLAAFTRKPMTTQQPEAGDTGTCTWTASVTSCNATSCDPICMVAILSCSSIASSGCKCRDKPTKLHHQHALHCRMHCIACHTTSLQHNCSQMQCQMQCNAIHPMHCKRRTRLQCSTGAHSNAQRGRAFVFHMQWHAVHYCIAEQCTEEQCRAT